MSSILYTFITEACVDHVINSISELLHVVFNYSTVE